MDEEPRVPLLHEPKIRIKPEFLLRKARHSYFGTNPTKAFENYILYLDNLNDSSEMPEVDQQYFALLGLKVAALFENVNDPDEVLKIYVQVLNYFPHQPVVLNSLGTHLFRRGAFECAYVYFRRASQVGYFPAEKNMLHTMWHMVPRWHFRMLNDSARNSAYRTAISHTIKDLLAGRQSEPKAKLRVLDIGAGCGLLSLLAAHESSAVQVVAFEESKTLCEMAEEVIKTADLSPQIVLHNENSNCHKGEAGRTDKFDLIVTEIFDAGLFGEGCLKSIYGAVKNWAVEEYKIIPSSADLYVTAFENRTYYDKYKFSSALPELGVSRLCLRVVDGGPYDSEFLDDSTTSFMTKVQRFYRVDFSSCNQLHYLLHKGHNGITTVDLRCEKNGVIHGFALWFDLLLNESEKISTKPNSDVQCWEQAVFYLDHPVYVKNGDILTVQPKIVNQQLQFVLPDNNPDCAKCYSVSRDIVAFLNDKTLVQKHIELAQSFTGRCDVKVFDFGPFPLFGLLMAKRGATLYHAYKDYGDLILFEHLVEANNLPRTSCIFVHECGLPELLQSLSSCDYVLNDFVKFDGSWNRGAMATETELRLHAEAFPKKIHLKFLLVFSDILDFYNKVDDSKCFEYGIAQRINVYSGNEHPSLDSLDSLKAAIYSTEVALDISDLSKTDFQVEANVIKDGCFNGIFYWFVFQLSNDPSSKFDTFNSSFYQKTCTYLNEPKTVKAGQKIMVKVLRKESYMKVFVN